MGFLFQLWCDELGLSTGEQKHCVLFVLYSFVKSFSNLDFQTNPGNNSLICHELNTFLNVKVARLNIC